MTGTRTALKIPMIGARIPSTTSVIILRIGSNTLKICSINGPIASRIGCMIVINDVVICTTYSTIVFNTFVMVFITGFNAFVSAWNALFNGFRIAVNALLNIDIMALNAFKDVMTFIIAATMFPPMENIPPMILPKSKPIPFVFPPVVVCSVPVVVGVVDGVSPSTDGIAGSPV